MITTTVDLDGRTVIGRQVDGVRRFLGIPFARAEHRFAAPEPAAPPAGYDAVRFGPAPHQPATSWLPDLITGDDNLTLAIWTPTTDATDLPVLLWVYGGGFQGGTISLPITDGAVLARAGMVVVAVQYRVGCYGFAELAHHGGRLGQASNLGLADVRAALRWTGDHVSAFGGDPARICLMGQSAGAFLGAALLATPDAPSIRRLILASGGASRLIPLDVAQDLGDRLVEAIGIDTDALPEVEPARLLAAQESLLATDIGRRNGPRPTAFGVVEDSAGPHPVITGHPMAAVASGAARHADLLITTMIDETRSWRDAEPAAFDPAGPEQLIAEVVGWGVSANRAEALVASYRAEAADDLGRARSALLTDYIYRLPAARLAECQRSAGGTARLLTIGRDAGLPAGHGSELPALFGRGADSRRDRAITATVIDFVRSDDVGHGAADQVLGTVSDDRPSHPELLRRWHGIERP